MQYNTFFLKLHYEPWLALTTIPAVLADRLNHALMAGQMSFGLDNDIRLAVAAVTDGHSPYTGELRGLPQIKLAEALRVLLQSPEYIVQK